MESTGKVKAVGAVVLGLVLLTAAVLVYLFIAGDGATYYTQIDNTRITENNSSGGVIDLKGGMAYSYTLICYNAKGKQEQITFGTDRELREGAFLRLEVVPLRGVVDWAEVQYEELPQAVKDALPEQMK